MAGVFQNIDPPSPSLPVECVPFPPAFGAGGGHTRWLERGGWGVSILEDVRHSSVLYVCKYFVHLPAYPNKKIKCLNIRWYSVSSR
jgi:hypothetical protein